MKPAGGGAALQQLVERDGKLTPSSVLAEAEDEASPLHAYFEWDDSEAARRYRLDQAGDLIRRYRFTVELEPERTVRLRSFVNLPSEGGGEGEYVSTQQALRSADTRDLVMQQALRDVAALRAKYQALVDFDAVLQQSVEESKRRRRRKAS